MVPLIIISSLLVAVVAYVIVARKDRSYLNVLTPVYFTFIPGYYLLELLHIHLFGPSGSVFAYAFSYSVYAVSFLILALVYARFRPYNLKLPFDTSSRLRFLPYVVLGLSILVYLPVLIEFREFLMSPREIYVRTRVGYGHMFFVSTMLTFLAWVLVLCKQRTFKGEKPVFFLACALLCLLHGSKGQVVQLVFIGLLYRVYVGRKRVSLRGAAVYLTTFAVGLAGMFYLLSTRNFESSAQFVRNLAGYADYSRNAIMVIDDEREFTLGRLTLESAVYSRVPRILYPDKPRDWGNFALAKEYYPEWFERATGSASFGILGVPYSDFGYLSIIYLGLWAAVTGYLLRLFVHRVHRGRSPSDFIMALFLASVPIIPGGMTFLLPEHLALTFLVALVLRFRWVIRTEPEQVPPSTMVDKLGIETQSGTMRMNGDG